MLAWRVNVEAAQRGGVHDESTRRRLASVRRSNAGYSNPMSDADWSDGVTDHATAIARQPRPQFSSILRFEVEVIDGPLKGKA